MIPHAISVIILHEGTIQEVYPLGPLSAWSIFVSPRLSPSVEDLFFAVDFSNPAQPPEPFLSRRWPPHAYYFELFYSSRSSSIVGAFPSPVGKPSAPPCPSIPQQLLVRCRLTTPPTRAAMHLLPSEPEFDIEAASIPISAHGGHEGRGRVFSVFWIQDRNS